MSHEDDGSDYEYEPYSTVGDLSEIRPYPVTYQPKETWFYDNADTRLNKLEGKEPEASSGSMPDEDLGRTFDEVHQRILKGIDPIVLFDARDWDDIGWAIDAAKDDFRLALQGLEETDDDVWKGATYRALKGNLDNSIVELEKVQALAPDIGILVEAFANTISSTRENIVREKENYVNDLQRYPEYIDEVEHDYDAYARSVMQEVYKPNIEQIAKHMPAYTAGEPGELGEYPGIGDGLDDQTWPGGGGSGGFDGLGSHDGSGSFDSPDVPVFEGAASRVLTDTTPTIPTSPNAYPSTSGLNGLTDPVQAASDAARNGLGPATDALKQIADGATKPYDPKLDGPPEGVLGLGPKGLGGSPSAGGAGGKTGAGTGTRLPRGFADARPAGGPVTSATRWPSTAGAVPGAGPGMMGPPGAGAPAGAQRGGDNNKGHQVLKALRRKKNGQDVVGEADAVVAVVGAPEKTARPNADQSDQAEPPGPDVRPAPRSARRPEEATQVSNP